MRRRDFSRPLLATRGLGRPLGGWSRALAGLFAILIFAAGVFGMDQAKPDEAVRPGPAMGSGTNPPAMGGGAGGAGMSDPHGGLFAGGMPGSPGFDSATMHQRLADSYARQDRTAFEKNIQLDRLRLLAIQHADTVKILDSWARQTNARIRYRQTIDGKDPLYVALDMAFRPEAWADKNIIYVHAIPIREQLTALVDGADESAKRAERDRLMHQGLASPNFLSRPDVLQLLQNLQMDSRRSQAVDQLLLSLQAFARARDTFTVLPPAAGIDAPAAPEGAPAIEKARTSWINPMAIVAPPAIPGQPPVKPAMESPYSSEQTLKISLAFTQLMVGWQSNDVGLANSGISGLVAAVESIHAPGYPSEAKRVTELWYNRSFSGTLVAFIYFAALTMFLLVAVGVSAASSKVEKTALWFFGIAVALHVAGMAVRWWLAGRIPIQNQFESVMGSACLGCLMGFGLERWKRNGIFGTAFSFVGFLAMTSCLAAPYVFGRDLGSSIGKVAGILTDAWLYIHVNIVIASYALIAASFCIALIYLGLRQWYWVNPIEPGYEGPEGPGGQAQAGGGAVAVAATPAGVALLEGKRAATLETLDQANMVVLQMATWFLGIGIICGAVWADHSWGRPWGWDPKETFALVTWIVYLLIVHIRFVTKSRADWSAWLAVLGFFVMMFNWVGVNFFLKGLHSYA